MKGAAAMLFCTAVHIVRRHGFRFVMINLAYFGLVCGGMAYGAWDRQASDQYKVQVRRQAADSLPVVFEAYQNGHFTRAVGLTFAVNLLAGSVLAIGLSSAIIPFSGLVVGAARAWTWGYIFTPSFAAFNAATLAYGVLVGLLLVLEGGGYTLAMLGSYLHGTSFLFPQTAGAKTHWQGYKLGAKWSLQLYALVAAVLLLAAAYEAGMNIYLMPLVR
jgi:hypothetical protein